MYFDVKEYVEINPKTNDCDVYMFIGPRRCGKTYSTKKLLCETFENHGLRSVNIRRFGTQLKLTTGSFFDKFKRIGWKKRNNRELIYNKDVGIFNLALTQDENIKGVDYPDVKYFFFDEFQTNGIYFKGSYEPNLLHNIIFTCSEYGGDIKQKLLLVSNSVSKNNPYAIYYGIKETPNPGEYKIYYKEIIPGVKIKIFLMNVKMSDEMKEKAKDSLAYKLASINKNYFDYSVENMYSFDNDELIKPNIKKIKHLHNVIVNNNRYGVWLCHNNKIVFTKQCPRNKTYALDAESAIYANLDFISLDHLIYWYRHKLLYNNMYMSDYTIRKDIIAWLKRQP